MRFIDLQVSHNYLYTYTDCAVKKKKTLLPFDF